MKKIYQILFEHSSEVMKNAYSPYSKIKVGAAVITKDGYIFAGCNVENSSYGATICAERAAITKAISEGFKEFKAIGIISDRFKFISPCGICRQFIAELAPNIDVYLFNSDGKFKRFKIKELLPIGFRI
ncbi:MAG: cytidine deaminase [Deltaproteobacteria bacterium]|nr:cytidine deaminase [Deltaproteobacteria bacterium]